MGSNSTPAIIFPSNMCRICIEFGKYVLNIEETFVDYGDNLISLLELLNLFSDIELNPSNPSSICSDCLTKATEAYQFKLQCDKSTRTLDKMKEALIDDNILEITIHDALEEEEEEDGTQLEENISKNRVPNQDANKENNSNSVEEVRPYSCCFCTETFKYLVAYKDHIQTHKSVLFPEEEEHICMKCGKSLPHSWALRVHKAKCEGTKPDEKAHKCWQCGEGFSKKKALRIHQCKVKPHVCELCDRQFDKASILKHHMMQHSNNQSFICDMCGEGFITDALRREHIRSTHEGKKRKRPGSDVLKLFLCSFCGLSFSRNCYLELHLQQHTQKEKQLQCEKCGRIFVTGGELRAHSVVHQDKKPFDCEQCGEAFSRKYDLKRHEIIHTGSRRYACRVCNHDYILARRLKYHLMVHCREETMCPFCGMDFRRNNALRRHLTEKHPEGDLSTTAQEDS